MKTEEEILEMHLGSDFYLVKENGMLKHIIAAMREYASQFKTVEHEKKELPDSWGEDTDDSYKSTPGFW